MVLFITVTKISLKTKIIFSNIKKYLLIVKNKMTTVKFTPLGTYHLTLAEKIKKISDGGVSDVYLYRCKNKKRDEIFHDNAEMRNGDQICNKLFVVKKIKKGLESRDEYIRNEFEIGRTLSHRNIIKTYGYDYNLHQIYLEYFRGIELFYYMQNYKSKNTRPLMTIFEKVLDAVVYLHRIKNIAHMDIKMENVLYNHTTQEIKLIDFGYSKMIKCEDTGLSFCYSDFCGTVQYLPPEVILRLEYRPDKVDTWCCGMLLYNLVYNMVPWEISDTESDRFFARNYISFSKDELWPGSFPDTISRGFTEFESSVLKTIFLQVFKYYHKKRINIVKLQNIFLLITNKETTNIQDF
jgi:serine/threonine protein kinase